MNKLKPMSYCKLHGYNSWPVSDIYCLLKTFANSLDPDQAKHIQSVGHSDGITERILKLLKKVLMVEYIQ